MLHLTKRVDYAIIALTHLALHPDERFSARGLAERYELSQGLLANVLKVLARGELLDSVRGTKGGYQLAEDPQTLYVGRVVELLEGPLRIADCVGRGPHDHLHCSVSRVCPVKKSVFKIHLAIRDVLYGMTVAELAQGAQRPGGALPIARSVPEPCLKD
jgi:Rrf2 family protein